MPATGEGINAQAGRINTQIIAANDLFLKGNTIINDDADLIAGDNLVIEAVDLTLNGEERKWYVDVNGQVHYRSAQVVAGDSVSVKLSGNYVQKGTQVLAKNQVAIQAKTISISNQRKANLKSIESFNSASGKEQKLWTSLLSMGLNRADNMLANRVTLKADNDITLTRARLRTGALKEGEHVSDQSNNKPENKNEHSPGHETRQDDDTENTAPGSLTLIADTGSINNLASYIASDSIVMQAKKDITTKSLQQISSNTIVNGRWTNVGYDDDPTYSQTVVRTQTVTTDVAEINAGKGGLVQVAGNDINNLGGLMASDGDIIQQAAGNINNKSLALRYLENQTIRSSATGYGWYGYRQAPRNLKEDTSSTKYNTAIQLASITAKGDIIQNAGDKIINVGSTTKATGNIVQTAKNGIENKNLISSQISKKYKRYVAPGYSGYDDDYYYYRRPVPKDSNTTTATYQENINTIEAGSSLVANVEDGDYVNKGNISAGDNIEVSANTIRNSRQVVGTGNNARVVDSGKVSAGKDITFLARKNIEDTAGRYDAGGNILLAAKENITQNTIAIRKDKTIEKRSRWGYVYDSDRRTSVTQTSGSFNSDGVTSLQAGKELSLTGTDITADNIELRGENITLGAAKNITQRVRRAGAYTVNRNINYDVAKLNSRNNIIVQADNNLTTQGSILTAGNDADNYIMLDAKGDINFEAVNNETYSYYYYHRNRSWGRSSTTIRETQRIRSQGTQIAGENLFINANVNSITASKDNNVNFVGSQLDIGNETFIKAQGDVNVYAALNYNYDMSESRKKGFGGFSSRSSGSRRSQQLLKATELSSRKGDLSLLSGNNITVVASNLTSGKDINLQADNNILIAAAEQSGTYDEWSIKSGLFTGGDLYNSKEKRAGNTTSEFIGSNLNAANDINIEAARAKIVGSTLLAANNILAKTDVGDIEVVTAANNEKNYKYEKEVSVSLGDFAGNLVRPDKWFKTENGRATMKIADATYAEKRNQNTRTTQTGSVLQAGNTISLNAAGDLNIEGSQLIANTSENGVGDVNLTAKGDINIKDAKESFNTQTKETQGKAELSIVVQNQAVEVANAYEELKKAKKQLKQANEDYRQYKKTLTKQKTNLAQLEAGYKNKDVGINYDDIRELREFIQSAEDDKTWYKAGIAAATLNFTSKGTLLMQQTGAAYNSLATYGFNAGVQLDIEASKTQNEQNQTASVASILQGNNIFINNKGKTLIKGSQLAAANDLTINTNNLDILASRDTANNTNKTEQGNITIAQTVYGSVGGPTVNASFSRSRAQNKQTFYTNSTLNAKNITLITKGDSTIRGGNVRAENNLIANIGKNLTIESVQNRTQSKNNSFSISGGFGFGAKKGTNGKTLAAAVTNVSNLGQNNGKVNSVNAGLSAGAGRTATRQTVLSSLTSGNSATINVKGRTQLNGALLATVDEDNNDLGNLNLSTGSIGFEDLSNTRFNTNRNAGISSSVGLGKDSKTTDGSVDKTQNNATGTKLNTTNIQYSNSTGYSKTKTLATLGQGNITIANRDESTLERLNRDTTQTNKDIYNVDRQQGNIDLTIDTRLFSKDGQNSILEDIERNKRFIGAIVDVATMKTYAFQDTLAHIDETQKALDVDKAFALANDGKNIKDLGNGSIKEKQAAISRYADIYADVFGVTIESARIIAAGKVIGGTTYTNKNKTRSSIAINDNAQRNATDYADALAHEGTHARIRQKTTRDREDIDLNEEYAKSMGKYAADGMVFSAGTYNNIQLNRNETTNLYKRNQEGNAILASNNKAWRDNLKRAQNGDGAVDYLLPEIIEKWRDSLNNYMTENRKISARLKGNAGGTALSVAAAPADVLADLANVLITTVDITTDGMGAIGVFGGDLQKEALQNLNDMGAKTQYMVENREAIAASILKALEEFPERILDLDPSALRSLVAIVGEAAIPAGALAKLRLAKQVDVQVASSKNVVRDVIETTQNVRSNTTQFRELPSVGAAATKVDLPSGYRRGVNGEGEIIILGPRGGIYQSTDYVDAAGNPLYSNNGKTYSLEGGQKNYVRVSERVDDSSKVAVVPGKTPLAYDISNWAEYGLPADGTFTRSLRLSEAQDFLSGNPFSFGGKPIEPYKTVDGFVDPGYPGGQGFMGRAEDTASIITKEAYRDLYKLEPNQVPEFVLDFQLKDSSNLQNVLYTPYKAFERGGKTGAGLPEFNYPGITTNDIVNPTLRKLK